MKTLEEFIEKQASEHYEYWKDGGLDEWDSLREESSVYYHKQLSYQQGAKETAAEILRVAEEYVEYPYVSEIARGGPMPARNLLDFLKSFIQPVKKESEDEN